MSETDCAWTDYAKRPVDFRGQRYTFLHAKFVEFTPMRLIVALTVLLSVFALQASPVQAQKLSGLEMLTPEERTSFNERFAEAPDSATRARIRQEQIKLIQKRRLEARKQQKSKSPSSQN